MMIEWHYHDSGTDRAGAVDALAGLARVLAELAGVGQHGGGGGGGGAATYIQSLYADTVKVCIVTG